MSEEERLKRLLAKQVMYHHYLKLSDSEGNYLYIDQSSDVSAYGDEFKCNQILLDLLEGMWIDIDTGETGKGYKAEFINADDRMLRWAIVQDLGKSKDHLRRFVKHGK